MRLAASLLGFAATLAFSTSQAEEPRIAIIIDDLGYQLDAGRRAIALPGPVAYAVLPGTPRGKALAQAAHELGKEVLLHLPLQAANHDGGVEPGAIMLDMSRDRVGSAFDEAIGSIPHVIGINTHRGSLLTRHPGHMRWLMEEINARQPLFFIDSYTTHESVAMQVAREAGVEALKRDVFLDPDDSPATVERQFERVKRLARQRGSVVAIGHPYPATLELLERELPKLADEGIVLVPVSELFEPLPAAIAGGAAMSERAAASE